MTKDTTGELDATTQASSAKERVLLERIFEKATAFYKDPINLQGFKSWQANKEETKHGTNYINS